MIQQHTASKLKGLAIASPFVCINYTLLKPISSLLQRVKETHEELVAGEGVGLIAGDAVERSNSIHITEPNSIVALFHKHPVL